MQRSFLVLLVIVPSAAALGEAAPVGLYSPHSFAASPAFTSVPGSYTIDTDMLEMSGPDGFLAHGALSGNVAVFTFASFELGSAASLTTRGGRPAAILSQTNMTISGNGIRAFAGGGAGGAPAIRGMGPGGGFPGSGFFGGAGGGGGFGGPGGRGQRDDPMFDFPGAGGPAYGDLRSALQGGSGGGGGKANAGFQSAGGDGGGGLELGAIGHLLIDSGVNADGLPGAPRGANHTAGGGGSGGGIRLHASQITIDSLVTANGGRGGDGVFENGGGGGGGRILIQTGPAGLNIFGSVSVAGGPAPSDFFGSGVPGQPGVLIIQQIPEPSTILGLITAIPVAFASRCRKRRVCSR